RIIDELPEQIYRIMVTEGKNMDVKEREQGAREIQAQLQADDDESQHAESFALSPLSREGKPAERHVDRYLQTALAEDNLETRLIHLAREARSALEEQGCNILFLTMGLVEWREGPDKGPIS